MSQNAIFGPFFATIGLTFLVWVTMFVRRIHFIRSNEISPVELAEPGRLAELTPAHVSNPSDNLKNLFEMPVLFYAVVLYLYAVEQVDGLHLVAAWIFVAFRVAHSVVHCTVNKVMLRFNLYLISSLALWFMVARAALALGA